MKVVYVAGPIRAANAWERELNVRRAEALALDVWNTGKAAAICPHAMGRFYDDGDFEKWMAGDLELVARSDAVLMVEGWEQSLGACRERDRAIELGKPVFYAPLTEGVFVAWLGGVVRSAETCVAWGLLKPNMLAHHDCPVTVTHAHQAAVPIVGTLPQVCPCECRTCKRAWEAAGRPAIAESAP